MEKAGAQAHEAHMLTGSQALMGGPIDATILFSDSEVLAPSPNTQKTSILDHIFDWQTLRFLVATILLTAAWFKWQSFGILRASFLAEIAPQLEWLLIQSELVIGIWLMVGWRAYASWAASLLMFSCFAGASLVMAWQGRSSCGCLGTMEFNPWWMFLFDLAIVGLLWRTNLGRGHLIRESVAGAARSLNDWSQFTFARNCLMFGAVVASTIIGGLVVRYSPAIADRIPPQLSGQFLVSSPAIVDLGQAHLISGELF